MVLNVVGQVKDKQRGEGVDGYGNKKLIFSDYLMIIITTLHNDNNNNI